MTPLAFRRTPALGSPPGQGTQENRSCSSATQDHPAPAHGASLLSTERALPSPPALPRRRSMDACKSEASLFTA